MERMKYENGVYADLSNKDYHASDGLSRSALMEFKKSPYHYQKMLEEASKEPTDAMILGDMVHTIVLEGHKFYERFIIRPSIDRRTNAGKAQYSEFLVQAGTRIVVSEEDAHLANEIALAVAQNDLAVSLIRDSRIEHSIYFTHATTGLQCKCRPDIWQGSIVGDLKTAKDASYRGFQSAAWSGGYFLQAGMIKQALYSLGEELEKFVFIVVENHRPMATGIYILDEEALNYGSQQLDRLMESFARCRDSNTWQGYGVQNLCLPSWAKFEVEND